MRECEETEMDRGKQKKTGKTEVLAELEKRILFFDGGTGSLLQAAGLEAGELPETWNITHPEEGENPSGLSECRLRYGKDQYIRSQWSEI